MCTMDAKQCPDGSFVGRVPPDCAFAPCPDETSAPTPPPVTEVQPEPTVPTPQPTDEYVPVPDAESGQVGEVSDTSSEGDIGSSDTLGTVEYTVPTDATLSERRAARVNWLAAYDARQSTLPATYTPILAVDTQVRLMQYVQDLMGSMRTTVDDIESIANALLTHVSSVPTSTSMRAQTEQYVREVQALLFSARDDINAALLVGAAVFDHEDPAGAFNVLTDAVAIVYDVTVEAYEMMQVVTRDVRMENS